MLAFIGLIFFFFWLLLMAFLFLAAAAVCKFIISAVYTWFTKPDSANGPSVQMAVLNTYGSSSGPKKVDSILAELPDWPITQHLRYVVQRHGQYHGLLAQVRQMRSDLYLQDRVTESSRFLSDWAFDAGKIAALNGSVSGQEKNLTYATKKHLADRTQELWQMSQRFDRLTGDLQQLLSTRSADDSGLLRLAREHAQIRAWNEAFRLAGS